MERCPNAVAVIPDVIGGDPDARWMMAAEAVRKYVPRKYTGRLMFVWHMDEPIDVLIDAARLFNFVAIGSCAAFDITKGASPAPSSMSGCGKHGTRLARSRPWAWASGLSST